MEAQQEALTFRPPHGQGTTDVGAERLAAKTIAVTAGASTAQQDTGVGGGPAGEVIGTPGQWVTFTFNCSCYIRFGKTGVGASTTSDAFIPFGSVFNWWVTPADEFFRAYGITAGSISYYISA